jgi:hypothetical protein
LSLSASGSFPPDYIGTLSVKITEIVTKPENMKAKQILTGRLVTVGGVGYKERV